MVTPPYMEGGVTQVQEVYWWVTLPVEWSGPQPHGAAASRARRASHWLRPAAIPRDVIVRSKARIPPLARVSPPVLQSDGAARSGGRTIVQSKRRTLARSRVCAHQNNYRSALNELHADTGIKVFCLVFFFRIQWFVVKGICHRSSRCNITLWIPGGETFKYTTNGGSFFFKC